MRTFKKALLVGAILMAASLSVPAAFYKWVDEHGVTQYSQNPPPSGQYQEIRSPSPASHSNSEQQPADTSPIQKDAATPAEAPPQDDQKQAKQQAREQNCQLAQQRLSELENHARIRYTGVDGSVRVMSEEEKQTKLVATRKMMEDMCQ